VSGFALLTVVSESGIVGIGSRWWAKRLKDQQRYQQIVRMTTDQRGPLWPKATVFLVFSVSSDAFGLP
jgi:hypothetical protein